MEKEMNRMAGGAVRSESECLVYTGKAGTVRTFP